MVSTDKVFSKLEEPYDWRHMTELRSKDTDSPITVTPAKPMQGLHKPV